MKAPECKSKGAYLFTPSKEGIAAGLRQESIQMGKKGNFTLPVRNVSAQTPIQVHKHVTVGTIGKAHLFSYDQFRTEVIEREGSRQEKL